MQSLAVVTAPRSTWYEDNALPTAIARFVERGIAAEAVAWYDDQVNWNRFDGALIRSPWDLYWHLAEFKRWLANIGDRLPLANPAPVVSWNLEKRYLLDLAARGVPAVPTMVIEPDMPFVPMTTEFVVKPATSGAAMNTARYRSDESAAAREHVARDPCDGHGSARADLPKECGHRRRESARISRRRVQPRDPENRIAQAQRGVRCPARDARLQA